MADKFTEIKPRTTRSTNGLLEGGNPELGDTVYDPSGKELGDILFFYDMIEPGLFRVKVAGVKEDPFLVQVSDAAGADGSVVGKMLIGYAGVAKEYPVHSGAVTIRID